MVEMVVGLYFIIAFCGLLLLAIIFGVFYFVIRRQVILRIFMPDRHIFTKRYFVKNIPKSINLGNSMGTYIIDETTFYKTFFGQVYHFTFNNPFPIATWDGGALQDGSGKILRRPVEILPTEYIPKVIGHRAQDISVIHDNHYLADLFSIENLDRIMLILIIGCIIGIVVLGILIVSQGHPPVEIANSLNNTAIIKNACISAIRGG